MTCCARVPPPPSKAHSIGKAELDYSGVFLRHLFLVCGSFQNKCTQIILWPVWMKPWFKSHCHQPLSSSLIGCSAPESGIRGICMGCWVYGSDLGYGSRLSHFGLLSSEWAMWLGGYWEDIPLKITILALGPPVSQLLKTPFLVHNSLRDVRVSYNI